MHKCWGPCWWRREQRTREGFVKCMRLYLSAKHESSEHSARRERPEGRIMLYMCVRECVHIVVLPDM